MTTWSIIIITGLVLYLSDFSQGNLAFEAIPEYSSHHRNKTCTREFTCTRGRDLYHCYTAFIYSHSRVRLAGSMASIPHFNTGLSNCVSIVWDFLLEYFSTVLLFEVCMAMFDLSFFYFVIFLKCLLNNQECMSLSKSLLCVFIHSN